MNARKVKQDGLVIAPSEFRPGGGVVRLCVARKAEWDAVDAGRGKYFAKSRGLWVGGGENARRKRQPALFDEVELRELFPAFVIERPRFQHPVWRYHDRHACLPRGGCNCWVPPLPQAVEMNDVGACGVPAGVDENRVPERLERRLHAANGSVEAAEFLRGRWFVEMNDHCGEYSAS